MPKTVELIYQPRKDAAFYSPGLRPGEHLTVSREEAKRLLATGQFLEDKSKPSPESDMTAGNAQYPLNAPPRGKKGSGQNS